MAEHFADFYDPVFKVLSNDDDVKAEVPVENIRPGNDPIAPEAGACINYDWTSGSFDDTPQKGEGTFAVIASSPANKTEATKILGLIRNALTAKAITRADNSKVIVGRFKQNDSLSDDDVSGTGRFQASVTYDVKFVPKPQ